MKIKEGFEIQNVCGEFIVVPTGAENVDYSKTAAYLWNGVADKESFTTNDMVQLLLDEYDVEESIALEDCELIVARWREMELLEE